MEMCLAANNRPGPIVTIRWWEHEGLDFEGMRMAAQEAERIADASTLGQIYLVAVQSVLI